MRFEPLRIVNGEQVITGHLIRGNVERLDANWKIATAGNHQTHVELELLIIPNLPVPGFVISSEVAYAADQVVTGVRDRAEGAN